MFRVWVRGHSSVTQLGVGGGVSAFMEKSVTKMYGSMLVASRGGGWGSNVQEKSVRNILMAP